MKIAIFFIAAVVSYCVGSWNPAITFSRAVYKQDIRECGSKNPGFTNFKRCFGNKLAWVVLALDLLKAALACLGFALAFGYLFREFQLGALFSGVFALLGHAFPVWYSFKGGKGFLVCLSVVLVTDWKAGLIATGIMVVLLLTTHFMSLSTVTSLVASPFVMLALGTRLDICVGTLLIALFVAIRHRENFVRLIKGTERKFYLTKKGDSK